MRFQRPAIMLAALWWGGLSALAFVAVPMLFATLDGPALAGPVAARLFTGCMKAMRDPGACFATSSTSFSEATSNPVTPFCARVSMTQGEGLAFTA